MLRHQVEAEFRCLGDATVDAGLVMTELFTNAMRHGDPPVTVSAVPFDGGVRLRVQDHGERFRDRGDDSRGLRIIDALTEAWGVEATPPGKTVWADVAARRP